MCGSENSESENALLIYPFRVCQIKRLRGVELGEEFRKQPAKLFLYVSEQLAVRRRGGDVRRKNCRIKKIVVSLYMSLWHLVA